MLKHPAIAFTCCFDMTSVPAILVLTSLVMGAPGCTTMRLVEREQRIDVNAPTGSTVYIDGKKEASTGSTTLYRPYTLRSMTGDNTGTMVLRFLGSVSGLVTVAAISSEKYDLVAPSFGIAAGLWIFSALYDHLLHRDVTLALPVPTTVVVAVSRDGRHTAALAQGVLSEHGYQSLESPMQLRLHGPPIAIDNLNFDLQSRCNSKPAEYALCGEAGHTARKNIAAAWTLGAKAREVRRDDRVATALMVFLSNAEAVATASAKANAATAAASAGGGGATGGVGARNSVSSQCKSLLARYGQWSCPPVETEEAVAKHSPKVPADAPCERDHYVWQAILACYGAACTWKPENVSQFESVARDGLQSARQLCSSGGPTIGRGVKCNSLHLYSCP